MHLLSNGIPEQRLKVSNEYLRGVVEGEGCFTLCTHGTIKVPTFALQMHERDKELLLTLSNRLRLHGSLYEIAANNRGGISRGPAVRIMVRDAPTIQHILIPFFYKKLHGYKGRQFEKWIEQMGSDPAISKSFKAIYLLYISGYYDTNPLEKFWESQKQFLKIV